MSYVMDESLCEGTASSDDKGACVRVCGCRVAAHCIVECVREGRVRVQTPVLGVKNRGKQHFDAMSVWVQRALDKDEIAALGGSGEEEGVERALADLFRSGAVSII